jgi:hypothetical protein
MRRWCIGKQIIRFSTYLYFSGLSNIILYFWHVYSWITTFSYFLTAICRLIALAIVVYIHDWNDWQNQSFEKGKVWTYVSLYSIEDAWQNVSVRDIIALNINWNIKLFTYCILLKKYHILIYSRIHMFCLFVIGDLISF